MKDKHEASESLYAEAREHFEKALLTCNENYEQARNDSEFVLENKHWDEEVRRKRIEEGRFVPVIPILKTMVKQEVNKARKNRPSIRVKAVEGGDIQAAAVLEGIIRTIEYTSSADYAYDSAFEQAIIGGFGYFRLSVDYLNEDSFDLGAKIERIPDQFNVIPDADSVHYDSSDWNNCFILFDHSEDTYKGKEVNGSFHTSTNKKGNAKHTLAEWWNRTVEEENIHLLSNGETVDAATYEEFTDMYGIDGVTIVKTKPRNKYTVTRYILDGSSVLDKEVWYGKYIPIIPVYGNDNIVAGRRVLTGFATDAKDSQIMFNLMSAASAEHANTSPKAKYIVAKDSIVDRARWDAMNDSSVSVLEYDYSSANGAAPIPVQGNGVDSGIVRESDKSLNELKMLTGTMVEQSPNNTPNREFFNTRDTATTINTFNFTDNLSRALRHAGRIILNVVKEVYTEGSVVSIMGENNVPAQAILPTINSDYDIEVNAGDNYESKRAEAVYTITELARVFPEGRSILAPALLDNLDFYGNDKVKQQLLQLSAPQSDSTAPSLDQQILMKNAENEALKLQVEQAKLQMEGQKMQMDYDVQTRKLKLEEQRLMKDSVVDAESLKLKNQKQELEEYKANAVVEEKAINIMKPSF